MEIKKESDVKFDMYNFESTGIYRLAETPLIFAGNNKQETSKYKKD